jgi:hypothetical protein
VLLAAELKENKEINLDIKALWKQMLSSKKEEGEERIWRYGAGAGGGVTLLSKPVEEFQEMELKVASLLRLLKIQGF